MDKVLAKVNARHNLETLFEDLQNYIRDGILFSYDGMVESYGIFVERDGDDLPASTDNAMKVTYTTPGSVNIYPGKALTSDYLLLEIPSPTTFALPGSNGVHTLYLKHKPIYDKYTAIMNGFNYQAGQNTAATRQYDSYEFVWDTDPGVVASGVVLADVTVSGSTVSLVDDRRDENIFILTKSSIPSVAVRTDLTTEQELSGRLTAPSLKVTSGVGSYVIIEPTTDLAVTVTASGLDDAIDKKHLQNTDTHTTATSFKIGYGSLGPGGVGLNVLTEPDTPSDVLNFRIVDISGGNNPVFFDTTSKGKLKLGQTLKLSNQGRVTVAWGYDGIVGTGGTSGTFTIDHTEDIYTRGIDGAASYTDDTFVEDELVGQWLYIPSQLASYKIISNTATTADETVLSVTTAGGSVPNLTGISTSTTARGIIHNGCDNYTVRMVPVLAASPSIEVQPAQQTIVVGKDGTVGIHAGVKATFDVPLGWKVNFYITASSANLVNSNEVTMGAGSYYKPTQNTKYSPNPISYTVPVSLDLPLVVTGSSTRLSAVAAPHGFAISLALDATGGWDLADEYEYVFTTDNAGADFANPLHERRITAERWIDVAASGTRAYNIKCRPLLCGQAIATALETSVTSGAGGQSPTDTTVVQFPVNLKTFNGTIGYNVGVEGWDLTELVSPAHVTPSGVYSQTTIPTGSILVDDATVLTTATTIPKSGTYKTTLYVANTANFSSIGSVYLYRETNGSPSTYNITYSGITDTTLQNVYTTFQDDIIVYVGEMITKASTIHEFLVDDIGGSSITLTPLDGVSTPTAGMFVANTTKRGRMLLYQTGVTIDYNITRGYMDCDVLKGSKARFRWYQDTLPSSNDSLLVSSNDTPYYQDSDVTIYAENVGSGIRTIVVDAFDDSSNMCNSSNVNGTFTLYGRPRTKADKNFESEFARVIAAQES